MFTLGAVSIWEKLFILFLVLQSVWFKPWISSVPGQECTAVSKDISVPVHYKDNNVYKWYSEKSVSLGTRLYKWYSEKSVSLGTRLYKWYSEKSVSLGTRLYKWYSEKSVSLGTRLYKWYSEKNSKNFKRFIGNVLSIHHPKD